MHVFYAVMINDQKKQHQVDVNLWYYGVAPLWSLQKIKQVLYHEKYATYFMIQYIMTNKFLSFDGGILFGISFCLLIDDKIKMWINLCKFIWLQRKKFIMWKDIDGIMHHIAQLIQIFNLFFVSVNDMPPLRQDDDIYNKMRWQKWRK